MDDSDRDPLIASVARELRKPASAAGRAEVGGPEFTARLVAAVEREPVPGTWDARPRATRPNAPTRVLQWVARPRTLRVSPLVGLAAAAGIAALAVLVGPRRDRIVV